MGEYQKTINRFFMDSAVCIAGYYTIVIPVVCYLLIHEGFSYIGKRDAVRGLKGIEHI